MGERGDDPAAHDLLDALGARTRFPPPGSAVECAVSGGPDSMALLVLAVHAGCHPTAVHVDHGLRPDSAEEFAVVEALATRLGVPARSITVDVADGPNLEDRARRARHDALGDHALLGHTLDDQSETVLWFLMRGTGPDGMAGMEPSRRPLLGLRRVETAELCRTMGIEVIDDPHNHDERFTRVRIRRELMPLLDEIAGRDVAPLLARMADQQRDVMEVIEAAAASLPVRDAPALAAADPAIAVAALRSWWRSETGIAHSPDAAAIARMLAVAAGESLATDVVAGWRLERTDQTLRLVPPVQIEPERQDR